MVVHKVLIKEASALRSIADSANAITQLAPLMQKLEEAAGRGEYEVTFYTSELPRNIDIGNFLKPLGYRITEHYDDPQDPVSSWRPIIRVTISWGIVIMQDKQSS